MSAATIVLGTDQWNAGMEGTASAVSRAASVATTALTNHFRLVQLAGKLWNLDKRLKDILETFYRDAARPSTSPPPTKERVREAIANIRDLWRQIDDLYQTGKAHGLTNRTLVGTALNSVRVRGDELLDIAESVELALESHRFDALFDRSLAEYRRGESLDVMSIK